MPTKQEGPCRCDSKRNSCSQLGLSRLGGKRSYTSGDVGNTARDCAIGVLGAPSSEIHFPSVFQLRAAPNLLSAASYSVSRISFQASGLGDGSRPTLARFRVCHTAPRGRKMHTLVEASQRNVYDATLCFRLRPTPNSMSHSLILAPITSG
jgi:hypothetical protein